MKFEDPYKVRINNCKYKNKHYGDECVDDFNYDS